MPLPRDVYELRGRVDAGETFTFRPFYGHAPDPTGAITATCLSQWFWSPFVVDDATYPTAEHFMMAEKARLFADPDREREIVAAASPSEAKRLGRLVAGFDDDVWKAHRFDIVLRGNRAKFSQAEALRAFLLGTGEDVLVEAAPRDVVWGIGFGANNPKVHDPHAWRGRNLLGFVLMTVREELVP